jgi:nicotinamide mononucleotide transporter
MSTIELVATVFGLASVLLTIRQNIWCWPTGLIMVFLYIFIFYEAKLYSDMGLQVIYVVLQIYGWYHWLHGGRDKTELKVMRIGRRGAVAWALVAVAGTAGLGYTMRTFTNASLPYWDAAATVMSLIAQWLMVRKALESWAIWIAVDVLSIGIYLAKALYPTTVLYVAFLVLATMGLFAWRKSWKQAQKAADLQPA